MLKYAEYPGIFPTRKEVWLKKLPKRIVEVVIIVRASPKTAETLPITGMNSATQKSGITCRSFNEKEQRV
jgi:hypothetical protein